MSFTKISHHNPFRYIQIGLPSNFSGTASPDIYNKGRPPYSACGKACLHLIWSVPEKIQKHISHRDRGVVGWGKIPSRLNNSQCWSWEISCASQRLVQETSDELEVGALFSTVNIISIARSDKVTQDFQDPTCNLYIVSC